MSGYVHTGTAAAIVRITPAALIRYDKILQPARTVSGARMYRRDVVEAFRDARDACPPYGPVWQRRPKLYAACERARRNAIDPPPLVLTAAEVEPEDGRLTPAAAAAIVGISPAALAKHDGILQPDRSSPRRARLYRRDVIEAFKAARDRVGSVEPHRGRRSTWRSLERIARLDEISRAVREVRENRVDTDPLLDALRRITGTGG